MLGRDFAIDEREGPFPARSGPLPVAVVVAPTAWDQSLIRAIREQWPTTPLVLMDPPAEIAAAVPSAAVGSWSDPLALPLLIDAIVGLRTATAGSVSIDGRDLTSAPVYDRYRAGLAHIPEDRHDRALVLEYSIAENLILGQQREYTWHADLLDRRRIRERAVELTAAFDIRPPDPDHPVRGMSGGNQQKVVVARELSRRAPRVLLCAQPTRGDRLIGALAAARDQQRAVGHGLARPRQPGERDREVDVGGADD